MFQEFFFKIKYFLNKRVSDFALTVQAEYDLEEVNGKKKEKEIIEGGWEAASFTTKGAKSICNKPGKQQTWLLGNIYDSRHCVTSLKRAQWEQAF